MHIFSTHKKNLLRIGRAVVALGCLTVLLTGSFYYRMGNIFFGQVPALYNVVLAQFFFERAAHPVIGKATPYAFHQLSRTHFIQGDLPEALSLAEEEMVQYPDHTSTYYIIGLTLGYMGREEDAIFAFSHYVQTHPSSWAGRNDMSWLQFRIGDIDGALETIEPAYQLYPDNPWVLNTYGVLLMNKGVLGEAHAVLAKGGHIAQSLTQSSWGVAYPGNDPRIYGAGLSAMQKSFEKNLALLEQKIASGDKKEK